MVTLPYPTVREGDKASFADPDVFLREIAISCEPVVVRGLVADWPSVAAARTYAGLDEYLCGMAAPRRAEAFEGEAKIGGRYDYAEDLSGFNFRRFDTDLPGALKRILANAQNPGSSTVYVGSLETASYLPDFAPDNPLAATPKSVGPRIWVGNKSVVSCHNDHYDNIACVVAGRRRFTLYPPEAIANLYVGPIDFTMAGRPVSLASHAAEDDPRYPRIAAARALASVAELGPGDALYLPKLWWHEVEATEPVNVLVNYWWDAFASGPDAPDIAMLLTMIAIAERPAGERRAWRALFDHYAFRLSGHPLAHIPTERHGILGPIRGGTYGRIRAHVMNILRGG